MLMLALALCVAGHGQDAVRLRTDRLQLQVSGRALGLSQVALDEPARPLSTGPAVIAVEDGRARAPLAGEVVEFHANDGTAEHVWRSEDDAVRLRLTQTARPSHLAISVEVENLGDEQRWLQTTIELPVQGAALGDNRALWDGRDLIPLVSGTDTLVTSWKGHFPMTCLWGDEAGVAIGAEPMQLRSWWHWGLQGERLRWGTRFVLEPGKSEGFEAVLYAFEPRYGLGEALERFYAIYPEVFRPAEGIDPRVLGMGGYIGDSAETRRLGWEHSRRFHFDWEYVYGPYQRSGDPYPTEETWDPSLPYKYDAPHVAARKSSLEEFRHWLRERTEMGKVTRAMLHYTLGMNQWIAETYFPEAIRLDAEGKPAMSRREGHFQANTNVFLLADRAWDFWTRGYRNVAEHFKPSGISFDNAGGTGVYQYWQQGSGVSETPGRMYWNSPGEVYGRVKDEHGVGISGAIAHSKAMSYIHTLHADGHRLAVYANGAWAWPAAVRADAGMLEAAPYRRVDQLWTLRRMFGRKPLTFWENYQIMHLDEFDWEEASPEQIRDKLREKVDELILYSLHAGALPQFNYQRGVEKLWRWLPRLKALALAGWRATPAAAVSSPELWISRFGDGPGSYLTLCNPGDQPAEALLMLDEAYLGETWLLDEWGDDAGRTTSARASGGMSIERRLGAREGAIYQAVVAVRGAHVTDADVACDRDVLRRGSLEARFSVAEPGPASLIVALPAESLPRSVTLNGEALAWQPAELAVAGVGVKVEAALQAANTLQVTWNAEVMLGEPRHEYLDFPFVSDDEQPLAAIVLPADAAETDRNTAARIQAYFRYWYAMKGWEDWRAYYTPATIPEHRRHLAELPIVGRAAKAQTPHRVEIVAGFHPDLPAPPDGCAARISVTGEPASRSLLIEGRSPEARERAMLRLLRLLDTTHQWYGKFTYKVLPCSRKARIEEMYLDAEDGFTRYPWDERRQQQQAEAGPVDRAQWWTPYEPDARTLLLCHWDDRDDLEYRDVTGRYAAAGYPGGTRYVEGRFGRGIWAGGDSTEVGVAFANYGKWETDEGTVEMWWRPDFASDSGREAVLLNFRADKSGGEVTNRSRLEVVDGRLRWWERDSAGEEHVVASEPLQFGAGDWVHVAATWEVGGRLRLLVNGEAVADEPYWTPIPVEDLHPTSIWRAGIWIGRGTEHNAGGAIDELRISSCPRRFASPEL